MSLIRADRLRGVKQAERLGFTFIELLVSIAVIGLLIGILAVAVGGARRSAEAAIDRQFVAGLAAGIASFENEMRFVPPLVKDNSEDKYSDGWDDGVFRSSGLRSSGRIQEDFVTDGSDPNSETPLLELDIDDRPANFGDLFAVNVFNFSTALSNSEANNGDREYLRGVGIDLLPGDFGSGDYRFSEYSLAYYLLGILPRQFDLGEVGMRQPSKSGRFSESARLIPPYFDIGNDADRLVRVNEKTGRYELTAPSGKAVRYYRWLHGDADPVAANVPNYFDDDFDDFKTYTIVSSINDLNVPLMAARGARLNSTRDGYDRMSAASRSASWAIVTTGPDGFFGDVGTEPISELLAQENQDPTLNDLEAREDMWSAFSEDNIVEVGGQQ